MSWDVYLMKVPENIITVEDMDDNFSSQPLGGKKEVLTLFKELFPEADFTDSSWGILDNENYSIEFNISNEDPVQSVALHIRGNELAVKAIEKICQRTGWRAIDSGSGDFIDFSNSSESGFKKWQQFRDQVLLDKESKPYNHNNSQKKKKWWKFWGCVHRIK
jgi:hypothetical protein